MSEGSVTSLGALRCAWCLEEGKSAVVREKEPLDDPEETHGVCPEHKALLGTPPQPTGQWMATDARAAL
jgi:hypothetical protein